MNINIHSAWFAASAWLVCVVVSGIAVEVFCLVTQRRSISEVIWFLAANYPVQVAVVVVGGLAHFFWQKRDVYAEYRKKQVK